MDERCLLYSEQQEESIKHIFDQCDYTMWILKGAMEAMGGIMEQKPNTTLNIFVDWLESIAPKAPAWGLAWTLLAILLWSVWQERNNGHKCKTHCSKEMILHQVIKTIAVCFKETKI